MANKHFDSEHNLVLVAVAKICANNLKIREHGIGFATPREVARELGWKTNHAKPLADGNRAKSVMMELTRLGKLERKGKEKLKTKNASATKFADAFVMPKEYD